MYFADTRCLKKHSSLCGIIYVHEHSQWCSFVELCVLLSRRISRWEDICAFPRIAIWYHDVVVGQNLSILGTLKELQELCQ